ncbi:MAG: hypothetical protein PWP52_2300 [Bacteroidales bacterium]|nr:hypothetical protein [Bacteroidales bacterium]
MIMRVSKKSKIIVITRRNDEGTGRRELNEVNLLIINSKRLTSLNLHCVLRFLHFLPAGLRAVRHAGTAFGMTFSNLFGQLHFFISPVHVIL